MPGPLSCPRSWTEDEHFSHGGVSDSHNTGKTDWDKRIVVHNGRTIRGKWYSHAENKRRRIEQDRGLKVGGQKK